MKRYFGEFVLHYKALEAALESFAASSCSGSGAFQFCRYVARTKNEY
jgi:hypothetical protein